MFFYLSKIFWFATQPSTILMLLFIAAVLFLMAGWRRSGFVFLLIGTIAYVSIVNLALGLFLIAPLEDRFPANPNFETPPDGILMLSGPIDRQMTRAREQISFHDGSERYIEFIGLLEKYPNARGVVSGGNPSIVDDGLGQAEYSKVIFEQLGFDSARIAFETQARNTYENAVYSYDLVKPGDDEVWVVVTSAYHMPRAIGVLRKAGWNITPYPVGFRSEGERGRKFFTTTGGEALSTMSLAMKEWIGLVVYYYTDRSSELFPSTRPVKSAS
ncbi:MAG: YdcF family protein [Pseudomonadota bacterium]